VDVVKYESAECDVEMEMIERGAWANDNEMRDAKISPGLVIRIRIRIRKMDGANKNTM